MRDGRRRESDSITGEDHKEADRVLRVEKRATFIDTEARQQERDTSNFGDRFERADREVAVGGINLPRFDGQPQCIQSLFIVSAGFADEIDLFSERQTTHEEPDE